MRNIMSPRAATARSAETRGIWALARRRPPQNALLAHAKTGDGVNCGLRVLHIPRSGGSYYGMIHTTRRYAKGRSRHENAKGQGAYKKPALLAARQRQTERVSVPGAPAGASTVVCEICACPGRGARDGGFLKRGARLCRSFAPWQIHAPTFRRLG